MKAEDLAIQDARAVLHRLSPPGMQMDGEEDCIIQFTCSKRVAVFDYVLDHHGGTRIQLSITSRLQQHLIANGVPEVGVGVTVLRESVRLDVGTMVALPSRELAQELIWQYLVWNLYGPHGAIYLFFPIFPELT
eukprot:3699475-Rhodomonas_salina.1